MIKTGEYPSIWRNGFITTIPKKDARNDFSDVVLITTTPICSKVYESFVAVWLKDRVLDKIDPRQFGNMPNTSKAHYLVSIIGSILQKLNEPDSWINLITIDPRKALDLICHNILVKKNVLD